MNANSFVQFSVHRNSVQQYCLKGRKIHYKNKLLKNSQITKICFRAPFLANFQKKFMSIFDITEVEKIDQMSLWAL